MAFRAHTTQSLSSNPSPSSLVTSITKILQTLKPNFNLTPQKIQNFLPLSQFSSHLNPNLVVQVIKNQTNPYHALFFFNWSSKPSPNPTKYYHTFPCYIAMVDIFLSHRLFTMAAQFLEFHNRLCDFMIIKLVKAYWDDGNFKEAIDWFKRAKMGKNGDLICSCNALLGELVRTNRMGLARAIFDEIVKEGGTRPDVVAYNTMINGYCKMGMVEDAQKVFDEMSCRPDVVTYSILVNGYCSKGMMVNARQIVDRMIIERDCLPNVVTYTTLIDGYFKGGEMEAAMRCWDEMVKQGCEPNVATYHVIANGFCLSGKVDEAKRLMIKMRLSGMKIDVFILASLLKGFCIVGRLDDAVKNLKDMNSLGIRPRAEAYNIVLREYCKLGKLNEAIALLKEMKMRGIRPSISSFNVMFEELAHRGELDEAVNLLKWMPDMGCPPNFLSYFTVISNLCKTEGRVKDVEELIQSMLRNGHKPDGSLYSCLIEMYNKRGDLHMAIRVFVRLQ